MRLALPVHQLVIGPDHPPGLHLPAVLALLNGGRVDTRPLDVTPDAGRYVIRNGRHRYVAAVIRGDLLVDCEVAE